MRVTPLTLDLKASRVGEATTSWGKLFHSFNSCYKDSEDRCSFV